MSKISSFSLKNFRNFKDAEEFHFTNISIIVGPNSSGKSSLTKALLLLKENLNKGLLSEKLICSNSVRSLGSFANIVNLYSGSPSVNFIFCINYFGGNLRTIPSVLNVNLKYLETPMLPNIILKGFSSDKFDTPGLFEECIITDENSNLIFKLRNRHRHNEDIQSEYYVTLNTDIIFDSFYNRLEERAQTKPLFKYEFLVVPENVDNVLSQLKDVERDVFRNYFSDAICSVINFEDFEELLGLEGGEVFIDLIEAIEKYIKNKNIAIITDISPDVNYHNFYALLYEEYVSLLKSTPFDSIFYIPAERANLNRIYGQEKDNLLQGILEKVKYGQWYLSNEFIEEWLLKFEIGDSMEIDSTESDIYRIYIYNGKYKTLIADLGYGITQLLPIILMAALRNPDSLFSQTIIIEEPELNLHPKFQSLIADLIVDAMLKFDKRFIIETHSEYLIRKLQYLVGSNIIKSENATLYYLSPAQQKGENPLIKEIKINSDGSLSDIFGKGFFDEAIHWQLELLHLKNKN